MVAMEATALRAVATRAASLLNWDSLFRSAAARVAAAAEENRTDG
jgi:hypothetical protein